MIYTLNLISIKHNLNFIFQYKFCEDKIYIYKIYYYSIENTLHKFSNFSGECTARPHAY